MSRRRVSAEEIYGMEDFEYREVMREELMRARLDKGRKASLAGTILISMVLLVAAGAVILHNLGMINFPK